MKGGVAPAVVGGGIGWATIARLGLVQAALGAIVVLTTSTMNRVMVVELALPATLPGALVGLHYAVQMLRPRWGHASDAGGRRTPWILGGMAILAAGGVGAALATAWIGSNPAGGLALAVAAFVLIGIGVGAAGTSLLALLAGSVDPRRRATAAMICWVMMIAGFIVTTGVVGQVLDPFSPARLVTISVIVSAAALLVTIAAVWGVEARAAAAPQQAEPRPAGPLPFRAALAEVLAEPRARRFTIFVFVSMLAYSGQDLILEPFAGQVFGFTPGASTRLAGIQHGGVLLGMLLAATAGRRLGRLRSPALQDWMAGGCIASAAALLGIATGGLTGPIWPLSATVFLLGLANGAFAVGAIGSMMTLAASGGARREGIRIGLWGSAQAIAFGLGGFLGTVAVDAARLASESAAGAYVAVFVGEALLFLFAAQLARRVGREAGNVLAAADPAQGFPGAFVQTGGG